MNTTKVQILQKIKILRDRNRRTMWETDKSVKFVRKNSSFSTQTFSGPFRTITASKMLCNLSQSNAALISSNGLTLFRLFSAVSYHLCRGLSFGLLPVNLFSMTFLKSDPSTQQTCLAHSNLFQIKKCKATADFNWSSFRIFPSQYCLPVHKFSYYISPVNL